MGYCTHFTLNYTLPKCDTAFVEELAEKGVTIPEDVIINQSTINLETKLHEALDSFVAYGEPGLLMKVFTESLEAMNWYRHDDDMREFSKLFPTIVFELCGEGDRAGDLWRAYYKNGKMQYCPARITYGEYDESKLE
jgi:hypothetical protein